MCKLDDGSALDAIIRHRSTHSLVTFDMERHEGGIWAPDIYLVHTALDTSTTHSETHNLFPENVSPEQHSRWS